jgi:hypothetical protein
VSGLGSGVTALPEFFSPTPEKATLIVVKQVVNDNGGTAVASDWTMTVTGGHATPATFPGAAAPGTTVTLDAGAYAVSESGPSGYSSAASANCAGTIAAGETKTCTITADDQAPPDRVAPLVACGVADNAWHGANVSIGCTAHDDGSGLADPADASFSLSTSVPAGTEDGDAATGSRQVCDIAGNCATAGPIGGNKIDRKAPVLSLPANKTVDATSPAGAIVSFTISASDGADPNPSATCTPSSGSLFPIGTTTVACTATDHVGNASTGSFSITVLGAAEQLDRLIQKVINASGLPPATKTRLIASLQSLLAGFDPTDPTQVRAVCTALRTFIAAVRVLSGHGITPAQAAEWIADANRIRAVLAC